METSFETVIDNAKMRNNSCITYTNTTTKTSKENDNNFFWNMVSVCYREKAFLFLKKIFFIYH